MTSGHGQTIETLAGMVEEAGAKLVRIGAAIWGTNRGPPLVEKMEGDEIVLR